MTTSTSSEICFPFTTPAGADCSFSSSELSSDLPTSNGRHSRISRRQIVQRTWLLNVVDEGLPMPGLGTTEEEEEGQSPEKHFGYNLATEMETDFLSYASTADTSADCHTYAVADPSDEVISIASSTFESSASCSSSSGGDSNNNQVRTEVRKVCEIFERKNLKMSPHHNNHNNVSASLKSLTSISEMYQDRFNSNNSLTTTRNCHHLNHQHHHQLPFKLSDPFANDKIVIEETAADDSRTSRQATESARNNWPNLRRCKSMGASTFPSSLPAQDSTNVAYCSSNKFTSIPLEEMPAPNIVKSVRHVFEQLEMRSSGDKFGGTDNKNSFDKPFSRPSKSNKEAKEIKEQSPQTPTWNPTRHSGSTGQQNQGKKELKVSRVLPLSRPRRSDKKELDCEAPKFISESILKRIRSFGTSTTYFGGAMISKLVLNRQVFPARGSIIHLNSFEEEEEDGQVGSFLQAGDELDEGAIYIQFHNFQQEEESCDQLRPRVVSVLPKSNHLDNNCKNQRSMDLDKALDNPGGQYLARNDENNNVGQLEK